MVSLLPMAMVVLGAAPGDPTALVELDAPESMVGLASQVTQALETSAAQLKLPVISPRELRGRLAQKKYEELVRCGGRVHCAAPVLEGLGIGRAVLGSLSRSEKHYLLKLWLVDLKARTVLADVDRPILIAARRFQRDVEQVVPPLLRGEREAQGVLEITTNVDNAQVSVNGESVGVAPTTLVLKPGKHEVHIERRKYLSITRLLEVKPDSKTTEHFRLLLRPGEVPDDQVTPSLSRSAPAADGPALRLSWWTWVAGGAALASGGAALYFGLTQRSQEKALLDSYDSARQVYRATRVEALAAQRNALIANVLIGVAAGLGALTAVSVVFDVLAIGAPGTAVAVVPSVGPGFGAVTVGGRF